VSRPAHIGLLFGDSAEPLTIAELDGVCRVCDRRRGDHMGIRGTHCPDGDGYSRTSTFVDSPVSADPPKRFYEVAALMHARSRGVLPVYRRVDLGNGRCRFELANEAEVCWTWREVLP
jgi:hypothetical protein